MLPPEQTRNAINLRLLRGEFTIAREFVSRDTPRNFLPFFAKVAIAGATSKSQNWLYILTVIFSFRISLIRV